MNHPLFSLHPVPRQALCLAAAAAAVVACIFTARMLEEEVFHDYEAKGIGEPGMYLSFVYPVLVYTRRPEPHA